MTLPGNLTTVIVNVGPITDANGFPANFVTFSPNFLRGVDGTTVVYPQSRTLKLDATGRGSIELLGSDDPDIDPTGWTYSVYISGPSFTDRFNISVPISSPVGSSGKPTMDLSDFVGGAASEGVLRPYVLRGLNDVNVSGAVDGNVLTASGSLWIAAAASAGSPTWNQVTGKPTFATVATSGLYNDLTSKPTFATVATSGLYNDLTGKPSLATVATTGVYSDLTGKPTIPDITGLVSKDTIRYNAKDHGVVGNGTTDDQAALQTIVNALPVGSVIFLPAGTYLLRSGVKWKSGISLVGAGAGKTILKANNSGPASGFAPIYNITDGSTSTPLTDCTFADFEIDGLLVTTSSYDVGSKGINILFMLRARFENLYIHDTLATGIGCDQLIDSVIVNCVVNNCGRGNDGTQFGGAGIGIGTSYSPVQPLIIAGCTTKNNATHGIFVEHQNGAFTTKTVGVRIIGNHVEGNRYGISDWGADGLVVSGNTIINNTVAGFDISANGVVGIVGRNGVLANNVISGNLDGVLMGDGTFGYQIANNRISSNTQHGVHLGGSPGNASTSKEISVYNNDIYSNANAGIRIDVQQSDGTISGNRIRNNGTASGAATDLRSAMSLNAVNIGSTIIGNRCWDNQGSKTQTYGLYLTASGSLASATVQANNLTGNLTGANLYAGGSSITGGTWGTNPGIASGASSSPLVTLVDGAETINGVLKYAAAGRKWNSGTLTPASAANTLGTAATMLPTGTQQGYFIVLGRIVPASVVSETLSVTFVATFDDNTTSTVGQGSITTNVTALFSTTTYLAIVKDGHYVKSLTAAVQSTITSSTANVQVDIIAIQN